MANPGSSGTIPRHRLALAIAAMALACSTVPRAEVETFSASVLEATTEPDELTRVAALLHGGYHGAANQTLERLYSARPHDTDGHYALLVAAAAALDPRNPHRQPGLGAELMARYIARPDSPPWTDPIAEVLYLLAVELSAGAALADSLAAADTATGGAVATVPWTRAAAANATETPGSAPAHSSHEPGSAPNPARADPGPAPAGSGFVVEYLNRRAYRPLPALRTPPIHARIAASYRQRIHDLEARLGALADSLAARERELDRIRRTIELP